MIINRYLMFHRHHRHHHTWPIRILKCSPITILSIHTPLQRPTMLQQWIILRLTICRIRIPINIFTRCIQRVTSLFHLQAPISRRHRWRFNPIINPRYHSGTRPWSKCAVTTVRRRTRGVLHHPEMDANLSFSLLSVQKKRNWEKRDVRFLVTSASNSSNSSTSASKQPCLVCHEESSGYHFGAYTCESCKAFYRRVTKGESSSVSVGAAVEHRALRTQRWGSLP